MQTRTPRSKWRIAGWLLVLLLLAGVGLIAVYRPERAIRVGTASVGQTLCEEVFISGLDPRRVFDEEIRPRPGLGPLLKRLRYDVDATRRQVVVSWAGHFASTIRYRQQDGCLSATADAGAQPGPADAPLPAKPADAVASAGPVAANPALQAALDRAFAEPSQPPYRRVRAIVVMRDGKIIAERYAPGIGPDTPLLGYSASKSVINALIGILVRQGKLHVDERAPVAAWADPADPRHRITLDQLLCMSSGLRLEEDDSGFDPVSKMLFLHDDDMAAYAEQAPLKATPGSAWEYTSGNTLIASAVLRDAVGGHGTDVRRFAQDALFGPVGMRNAVIELDGAGTPVGSTRIFASARDWARFGQLYLDDGVVDGQRLLPEGWVRYATTPTLGSDYGAGFWLNRSDDDDAHWRVAHGMPAEAFYASGLFGQRVVVVPSKRLVIARLGATMDPPNFDMPGLVRLIADVIASP